MIKNKIIEKLNDILSQFKSDIEIDLQPPTNLNFGDYSTSIALKLTKILKKNPMEIAEMIKKEFHSELIEKIDIIKPGFLNFWINKKILVDNLLITKDNAFTFPKYHLGSNKKIMVEYAHPNTHKLFHIGHLRNISTGESISRILEAVGNQVVRTNYQGDVGLHIAKCLYGIQKSKTPPSSRLRRASKSQNLKTLQEKIEFIGQMYTQGTKAYEEDNKAKDEILRINKMIYDQNSEIMPLWTKTRQWSLDYFNQIYARVETQFDRLYFESEFAKKSIEIVSTALKKKILEKSQGAIIFNGKPYGLDTRVFINSLGFPTYEGKELALAEAELSEFGDLDKNIHCVTPEQTSFFKVTFKVEELLNEKKFKNKQYHLIYEWVNLKEGKMSSRVGNIIEGNWLIDQIKNKIKTNFKCNDDTAEILAIASIKYSFLKNSTQTAIAFDIDESISVDGASAPYIIYTYVRCYSILSKVDLLKINSNLLSTNIHIDELGLLRKLYQFPDTVLKAAQQLSPNYIATYLYELASQYNLFYQKNPILKAEKETKELRILITKITANTIKQGLYLLGIKTVEKM